MKTKLLNALIVVMLLLIPTINFAQAPPLGTAAGFALFTTVGAVTNVGTTDRAKYLTKITGNVGTNSGSSTGFGNVNGVMHDGDGASSTCAADLLLAYNFLSAAISDSTIINPVLGNNTTLKAGTYFLPGAASLNQGLTLDAQGDPNAVFIFRMPTAPPVYAFNTSVNSKIHLKNGAQASNVYWLITGAVNLGTGTTMRGTIISGGAINLSANDTLEGRALTINGAITVDNGDIGVLAYTPVIYGAPLLTGPVVPTMLESKPYAVFSSIGPVVDNSFSHISGDVGGNTVAPTNFNPLFVTGGIYGMNGITAAAAADLLNVYNTLNTSRPEDIVLLAPTLFGHNLVLTPHTYLLPAAVTFTDTLYLDGMGNPNAVFIIRVSGAFATTVNSKVILKNGTQAKNIFWLVNGAVSIGGSSVFNGTIVAAGAIDLLTGGTINGRALTINGAVSVASMTVIVSAKLITTEPVNQAVCPGNSVSFKVKAAGSVLSYKWRKGAVVLANGGSITGATSETLTINPTILADASLSYNVIVSESGIPKDTSINVSLTFNTAPSITTQPVTKTSCAGSTVSFTVVAAGTGLTYQWRKGTTNLINAGNITGATSAVLKLNPVNIIDFVTNYNVVVTGTCTPSKTSNNVSLTDNSPKITTQPANKTACTGGTVSLSVTATGTGLTYQWRKGTTNLSNTGNISGATSAALTINPVNIADAAANYNVVVTGTCAPNATSNNASLAISTASSITTQPTSQTACAGSPISFSVTAAGTNLTYKWRKGDLNLTDGGNISGTNSAMLTFNPANVSDAASNYNVVVSGACLPNITSTNVSLVVNSPSISAQPANQTACAGSPVSLSVVASGIGLSYQWKKGNLNLTDGGNISGANSSTLTFNPVNINNIASDYQVVVSGTCGLNVTSTSVSLAVNTAPGITTEPANKTICAGSPVSFVVAATGTGLTYQWRKGNSNLTNGGNISGATSDTLAINPANILDIASNYNVVVHGTCAPNDTSLNASLAINSAPGITTQPVNKTACTGSSISLSVVATGTGLTYQWRKGNSNLSNGDNISGANTATLTINPVNISNSASNYNVVITGTCSPNVTSGNASLVVNTTPVITTEPANQSVCAGSSASFSVVATGTALTYQWKKGALNLTNGGNISGANSVKLTINPANAADIATDYKVVVTGTCSLNDTSRNASLAVNIPGSITTEPDNQIACAGDPAIFSVEVTGTVLSYQWRKGPVQINNGGNISGATSNTLTINPVSNADIASNYSVFITGACGSKDTSINVSLVVNTALGLTPDPITKIGCIGSSASFSVAATGTNLTYQWRKGALNLTNGGNISGANTKKLTINPLDIADAASNYNLIITGPCAINDTSKNASLIITTSPSIFTEPATQIACDGSSASFSVAATGTGLTYQWRLGDTNLNNGGNISGAKSATLAINPVNISDAASNYNVVIGGPCAPNVTSTDVSLIIYNAPIITSQPENQIVCAGSSVNYSVIATGTDLNYQWRKGTVNLTNGGNISGANSEMLIINPVNISDAASNYNVVIIGTCSPSVNSANVSLAVNPAPTITTEPVKVTACAGNSISFSVIATGTALTYQWREGASNLTNGGNISGVNTSKLTIYPVNIADTSLKYNVYITGTCSPNVNSINAPLIVNTPPVIIAEPVTLTVCPGNSASFSVTAEGTGLTYQWRKGFSDLTNGTNISGATSSRLTISPVNSIDAVPNYNVVVSGTCSPNVTSIDVPLLISTAPAITVQPVKQTICAGSSISFSVTATGTGITYQWRKGVSNLTNAGNISGATSPTLTISPTSITDIASNYNVVVSGTCSPSVNSVDVPLVVNSAPGITTQPVNKSEYNGSSVSFSVIATGPGLTYQWRKGLLNLINAGNLSGVTTSKLTINPAGFSDAGSDYYVEITGTCAPMSISSDASLLISNAIGIAPFIGGSTNKLATFYPNPFSTSINVMILEASQNKQYELRIYTVLGEEVIVKNITNQLTTIGARHLPSGIYLYRVIENNKIIQSGKLISQQ